MIYADNAATTRLSPHALEVMTDVARNTWGNPSSLYELGQRAQEALSDARSRMAALLGADAKEIYFTSGGSEGDNQAIRSCARLGAAKNKRHIISTAFEHHAVLHTLKRLEKEGYEVTYLPVHENGIVTADEVKAAIRPDTCLVTIMFANNEIGTIQPIREIGAVCQAAKVPFHTDAVQAAGHIRIDVKEMNIDLLSLSAHKFHGPRGVGAAYIRKGVSVSPLITGGEQEKHRRAGTENVAGIVAMAEALQERVEEMEEEQERLKALSDRLIDGVLSAVTDCQLTGHRMERLPSIVSFLFEGVSPDELLALLDMQGVAASAGSACTAGSNEPSHVLQAMGLIDGRRCAPLRLSMGRCTTEAEIDRVLEILPQTVARLRG